MKRFCRAVRSLICVWMLARAFDMLLNDAETAPLSTKMEAAAAALKALRVCGEVYDA